MVVVKATEMVKDSLLKSLASIARPFLGVISLFWAKIIQSKVDREMRRK